MRPWTRPHPASHPLFCCSSFTWPSHSLLRRGTRDSTSSRWETFHHSYYPWNAYSLVMCRVSTFLSWYVECRYCRTWSHFFAFLFPQDANECWLQMMRVLQQKLESLEPETPMEVKSCWCFLLTVCVIEVNWGQLTCSIFAFSLLICRPRPRAELPLPLRRRTSLTSISVSNSKLRILAA